MRKNIGDWIIIVLCGAMLLLMYFNYATTRQTFSYLLGATHLITVISLAMSLVDAAGIALVTTSAQGEGFTEDAFIWMMFVAWILAAVADIALTYAWASLNIVVSPAAVAGNVTEQLSKIIPWAIAVMEFGIRVPLVIGIGRQFSGRINKTPVRLPKTSMPSMSTNRPHAQSFAPPVGSRGVIHNGRSNNP